MSALSELHSGEPSDEFVALVARTVPTGRNFPPPDGYQTWETDAVLATTSAFFASEQTARRLADLRLRCTTESGLRRLMQTTVRNFLADVGRRTDVGRLVRRVNEVLSADPKFERDGDVWRLVGTTGDRALVDFDDLVAAASRVDVGAPSEWGKSSRRNSPDIDKASVIRLTAELLERAGGPLRPSVIAQVAARRLGVGQSPLSLDATAFDPPAGVGIDPDITADGVMSDDRADEVFNLLNDAERAAIGLADFSASRLGEVLHVSKSTGAVIRSRAVALIRTELGDADDGQEIANRVLDRARESATSWMDGRDATY